MSTTRVFQTSPLTRFRYIKPVGRGELSLHPEVFKIHQLESKITQLDTEMDSDDLDFGYKIIRFLLTSSQEFTFGKEGVPTKWNNIPAHSQLSPDNTCITAGNLFYNKDNRIAKITHKSGDFRPSFQSLQFALFKMIEDNRFKFANEIKIESLNDSGGTEQVYTFQTEDLINEINQLKNESDLSRSSSPAKEQIKKRVYEQLSSASATGNEFSSSAVQNYSGTPSPCRVQANSQNQNYHVSPNRSPYAVGIFAAVSADATPAALATPSRVRRLFQG